MSSSPKGAVPPQTPASRRLRLLAGAAQGTGVLVWVLITLWTGNMALGLLYALAPGSALFA